MPNSSRFLGHICVVKAEWSTLYMSLLYRINEASGSSGFMYGKYKNDFEDDVSWACLCQVPRKFSSFRLKRKGRVFPTWFTHNLVKVPRKSVDKYNDKESRIYRSFLQPFCIKCLQ